MAQRSSLTNEITLEKILRTLPCGACGKVGGAQSNQAGYNFALAIRCKFCKKSFEISLDAEGFHSLVATLWVAPLKEVSTPLIGEVKTPVIEEVRYEIC